MFSLKERQDGFRLLLPEDLIPEEINDKYSKILKDTHSFWYKPIDVLNESIQKVDVFGFTGATVIQQQPSRGLPTRDESRKEQNNFLHMANDVSYRSPANPLQIVDKTINIDFRHELGFYNYMLLLESFLYNYSRDTKNKQLPKQFNVDILSDKGTIYSRLVLYNPVMDAMDMLSLDKTQPVAQSQSFRGVWKYSNFDYQFISFEDDDKYNLSNIVCRQ